ncbi:hypothetical protein [Phaeospirillum tilakii]|uniref:Phage protein n=1 Tax=Phaeospirillum tilakii TaxID=741673 RepID=A0ABW5C7W2_9PROT
MKNERESTGSEIMLESARTRLWEAVRMIRGLDIDTDEVRLFEALVQGAEQIIDDNIKLFLKRKLN